MSVPKAPATGIVGTPADELTDLLDHILAGEPPEEDRDTFAQIPGETPQPAGPEETPRTVEEAFARLQPLANAILSTPESDAETPSPAAEDKDDVLLLDDEAAVAAAPAEEITAVEDEDDVLLLDDEAAVAAAPAEEITAVEDEGDVLLLDDEAAVAAAPAEEITAVEDEDDVLLLDDEAAVAAAPAEEITAVEDEDDVLLLDNEAMVAATPITLSADPTEDVFLLNDAEIAHGAVKGPADRPLSDDEFFASLPPYEPPPEEDEVLVLSEADAVEPSPETAAPEDDTLVLSEADAVEPSPETAAPEDDTLVLSEADAVEPSPETAAPEAPPPLPDAAPPSPVSHERLLEQAALLLNALLPQPEGAPPHTLTEHDLPKKVETLAALLDETPPSGDFHALDLLYACWPKTTSRSKSKVLLAVALNLSRFFGLPGRMPMAASKAWRMLDAEHFQPELTAQLRGIGDFISNWQREQSSFLILEFGEIELIEYLFESLHPADHQDLLTMVMNFKVLSNRRLGLLRRIPNRLRKQVQPMLPERKQEALVLLAHTKALLDKLATPPGFGPILEAAAKMSEEVEKLMKQTAGAGAPPPPGGGGGGQALGRIG